MTDIIGLKCPNCGASISSIGSVCSYCGSRIVQSDDGNCRSCEEGIPIKSDYSPSSGDKKNGYQPRELVVELAELERANSLLNSKLHEAEGPGGLIAPAMFAAASICIYADSGETIGLLISAFLGVSSIGLFWYHFFSRKRQVPGIRNEIVKVQQKLAVRKKEALESGGDPRKLVVHLHATQGLLNNPAGALARKR